MSHFPSDSYRLGAANRDLDEEALGWVVRLTSGEVTAEDEREFAYWHMDPENAKAYERAKRLWNGIGPILEEQEAAGWPDATPDPVAAGPSGRRVLQMSRVFAFAASIALGIF